MVTGSEVYKSARPSLFIVMSDTGGNDLQIRVVGTGFGPERPYVSA